MNLYIKIRNFLESKIFTAIIWLLAALFVVLEEEEYGLIILLNIGAVVLLFSENISNAYLPGFLGVTFLIKCYVEDYAAFPHWWTALPFTIPAIIAYLIIYRRKITVGKSFWGVLAVTVAVTLGGMFTITPTEYFDLETLYYTIGLGVGLLGAYIFVRAHTVENDRYDIFERYANMMVLVCCFAVFMVLEYYLKHIPETLLAGKFASVQWSNNISTTLMITMPFVLYRVKKNSAYLLLFFANYASIILAGSRGGWVMGTIELAICLAVGLLFLGFEKHKKIILGIIGLALVVGGVAVLAVLGLHIETFRKGEFVSHDEARIKLIARSFEDFMGNPVFGQGLGYKGNNDVFKGNPATIGWYHMFIPQIVGSMGLVGMFCYGKQLCDRFKMILAKPDAYVWTLGLSYIGILLMTQVNPGEFCPMPYAFVTMTTFVMLERYNEKRGIEYEKDRT